MTARRLLALLVLLVALGATGVARADDKAQQAAEHFALADQAEKRQDWEAAILEYKQAYALKPHPSVLYNIARDYERLEEWAEAAEYYQRYLDDSKDASDRDKVTAKIETLRAKAEASRPPPTAGTGRLEVFANVDGADVKLDGAKIGVTPFDGDVASGTHQLVLSLHGYRTAPRQVIVQSGGTETVRERLESDGSGGGGGGGGEESKLRFGVHLGYGYALAKDVGYRFVLGVGVQGRRAELNAFYGKVGRNDGAFGAEARVYFAGDRVRPYVRGAATIGHATVGNETRSTYGAEGGAGILWSALRTDQLATNPQQRTLRFEYFLEANVRVTGGGYKQGEMLSNMDVVGASDARAPFFVSLDFGMVFRW